MFNLFKAKTSKMRTKVDITGFDDDFNKKQESKGDNTILDRCYLVLKLIIETRIIR